jgi:hypothetical protein
MMADKKREQEVEQASEAVQSGIRSRIVGHGMERVTDLVKNPENWRVHPKGQIAVVSDSMHTLGWLRGILKNTVTGNMVDGHLRVEIAEREGEEFVPCDYVELTQEEEGVALALLDPSGAMATANQEKLNALLERAKAFFGEQQRTSTFKAASALLDSLKRDQRGKKDAADEYDQSLVQHTGKRAMTPDEKVSQYENTTVRQIMLAFDVAGFKDAMQLLELIRAHAEVDTNAEAVLVAMQFYCERNELTVPPDADETENDV